MDIQVTGPDGMVHGNAVTLAPGQEAVLKTSAAGEWRHDGSAVAWLDGTLRITMDRDGTNAGDYVFISHEVTSAVVTIAIRKPFGIRLMRGLLPFLGGTVLMLALGYFLVFSGLSPGGITWRSYAFACLALAYGLFLLWLVGKAWSDSAGLIYLVKGEDRRASTSKVQYLIWTLGIAFVLAYIAARNGIAPDTTASFICGDVPANCIPEAVWDDYLILLGLPAATAALAKGVTVGKVAEGTLQKPLAEETKPGDIATDDRGHPDLVDVQYLLFNLIAFLYVAVNFVKRGVLVEVPGILLGLTSAAAGTYVLSKTLQNNKPVIVSVSPTVASPGTELRIRGHNLFPLRTSRTSETVTVDIGGVQTSGSRAGEDVVVVVPAGMSEADATVAVTTAANVTTEKYPLIILDKLTILGLNDVAAPRAGQPVRLVVEGLPDGASNVRVRCGSMVAAAETAADGVVIATIPPTLPPGNVDVKVGVNGRWSDSFVLTLAA